VIYHTYLAVDPQVGLLPTRPRQQMASPSIAYGEITGFASGMTHSSLGRSALRRLVVDDSLTPSKVLFRRAFVFLVDELAFGQELDI
jgi:hypothetical protein